MYFRVCGCYVLLFFCFSLGVIAFRAFAFLPEKIKKASVLHKIVSRNVGNCGTYFTIVMRNFACR